MIGEVRAPGTGADLVVGAVHDVVGEELRAPLEEVPKALLSVLGVELEFLLHRDPGKLQALALDLLVLLRLLHLELRELVASRLPVLAGSNPVLGHRLVSSLFRPAPPRLRGPRRPCMRLVRGGTDNRSCLCNACVHGAITGPPPR